MPPDRKRGLGAAGEALVATWYQAGGATVVDRNWRCRHGEIDLIVQCGPELVFCEVKTRSGRAFGFPFEAVTAAKQRRLRVLAQQWLQDHPDVRASQLRFDVASVTVLPGASPEVEVIEAAF